MDVLNRGMPKPHRVPRMRWYPIGNEMGTPPTGRPDTPPGVDPHDPGGGTAPAPGPGDVYLQLAEGDLEDEVDEGAELTTLNLQRQFVVAVDHASCMDLVAQLRKLPDGGDTLRKLEEMRDPATCPGWMHRLDPTEGPVVPKEDFTLALQLWLGGTYRSGHVCLRSLREAG